MQKTSNQYNHSNDIYCIDIPNQKIKKSGCIDTVYLKKVAILIGRIALGIFIIPLIIPQYYSNIKRAYRDLKSYKKEITPAQHSPIKTEITPAQHSPMCQQPQEVMSFEQVITSVRTAGKYKDKSEFLKFTEERNTPLAPHFSKTAQIYKPRFDEAIESSHTPSTLIKRSMGPISLFPKKKVTTQWCFYMPGLALIATYLKQKNNLKDLYVCDTLIAFQEKLKAIANSPNDERVALVIPLRPLIINIPNQYYQSQHKVSVCIEKIEGKLKIVVLDESARPNTAKYPDPLYKGQFLKPLTALKNQVLNESECTFWFINNCDLNFETTELYIANVTREKHYGCEIFSIRDAVSFLQNPDFFNQIQLNSTPIIVQGRKIEKIDVLPPEFMKGTQSKTVLDQYVRSSPALATKNIRHNKGTWTLPNCVAKHEIAGKNHYISSRSYKYYLILLEAIEKMKTAELEACMRESLIEAPADQVDVNGNLRDDFAYLAQKSGIQVTRYL